MRVAVTRAMLLKNPKGRSVSQSPSVDSRDWSDEYINETQH